MIDRNLGEYIESNYAFTKKTITEISSNDNGKSLVKSDKEIYCFDDISGAIYPNDKPTSVDGLLVMEKTIYFIEFKSGFKQNITKQNFDSQKMGCPRDGVYCKDYAELFFKKQKSDKKELKQNIRMKAIETYVTVEKCIFPQCEETSKQYKLNLIVVIDGKGDDENLSILNDLSGKSGDDEINDFDDLKKSLKPYMNKKDDFGNDYYYDEIKVMSPTQFIREIENII